MFSTEIKLIKEFSHLIFQNSREARFQDRPLGAPFPTVLEPTRFGLNGIGTYGFKYENPMLNTIGFGLIRVVGLRTF